MCLCELRGKTGCCDKDDLPPRAPFSTWTCVRVRPAILITVTSRVAGDLHFFFVCLHAYVLSCFAVAFIKKRKKTCFHTNDTLL